MAPGLREPWCVTSATLAGRGKAADIEEMVAVALGREVLDRRRW